MQRSSSRVKRWCLALGLGAAAGAAMPATDWAGRWQGQAEIPGAPMALWIDLTAQPGGGWAGSAILPGRGVKGVPLEKIGVSAGELRFTLAEAFGNNPGPVPEVRLAPAADGRLVGEFRLGTLSAPLQLVRSGAAQVDLPVPATALAPALLGTWTGRYELGGYPREVTLTLANQAGGLGRGELLIVGRRRTSLAIDHVVQGREFVTLSARAAGLRIEGAHATADGSIQGRLVQGPFEAPLVLRRSAEQPP